MPGPSRPPCPRASSHVPPRGLTRVAQQLRETDRRAPALPMRGLHHSQPSPNAHSPDSTFRGAESGGDELPESLPLRTWTRRVSVPSRAHPRGCFRPTPTGHQSFRGLVFHPSPATTLTPGLDECPSFGRRAAPDSERKRSVRGGGAACKIRSFFKKKKKIIPSARSSRTSAV